ncbi:MAG: helix-turn-helix transcriptional regulator [Nevskia sp.]|nr:helix-turn-helix transcriptional regulator [Nevskia sp.]
MARHAGRAERLLRALASRHRLMVLCALAGGELSVGALNDRVPLSQSALSQHLAVLRADGLVNTRRDAQTIFYSVPEGAALQIIRVLHSAYCCTPGAPRRPRPRRRSTGIPVSPRTTDTVRKRP